MSEQVEVHVYPIRSSRHQIELAEHCTQDALVSIDQLKRVYGRSTAFERRAMRRMVDDLRVALASLESAL